MRIISWIVAAIVVLIAVGIIVPPILRAPSKDVFQAGQDFISVSQQHVKGEQIDTSTIRGDNVNADCVRIFAEYLNKVLSINSRLAQVKNNLYILAQPAKLAVNKSIYEELEKQQQYDLEITSIETDYNAAIQEVISKIEVLDKSNLKVLDTVQFVESMKDPKGKAERDMELQQYKGLSQYIKQLLEFTKSRNGYYQLGQDGFIRFTRPEDQEYYTKLITGINQYVKIIGDIREQHSKEDRKLVSDMTSGK